VLVTKPTLPMTTVKEFIEYARKNPGKISYGSSGNGSSDHLTAEVFKQMTGTFGVHIPYRGGAAAVADLIGGQIEASFQNLGAVTGHIKAGRLKALAVTSSKRHPSLPDVPTMAEAGYPDLVVTSWQAVAAPAGTPKEVVAKLHEAVVKAMRSPDVRDRMLAQGFDVLVNSPDEFSGFMKAEISRWKKVVDTAKITVD
jgi:tripartite-type tricarboxylate transporter receptor subunit TctC